MNKREVEIRRLLLHMEMINIRARHEVEHRDGWTCNWAALLVDLDAELQAMIAEEDHPQHTWQQERAAVVVKLNQLVDSYRHVEDVDPCRVAATIRDAINNGEHWQKVVNL